jgi:hypothetical protein
MAMLARVPIIPEIPLEHVAQIKREGRRKVDTDAEDRKIVAGGAPTAITSFRGSQRQRH